MKIKYHNNTNIHEECKAETQMIQMCSRDWMCQMKVQ